MLHPVGPYASFCPVCTPHSLPRSSSKPLARSRWPILYRSRSRSVPGSEHRSNVITSHRLNTRTRNPRRSIGVTGEMQIGPEGLRAHRIPTNRKTISKKFPKLFRRTATITYRYKSSVRPISGPKDAHPPLDVTIMQWSYIEESICVQKQVPCQFGREQMYICRQQHN